MKCPLYIQLETTCSHLVMNFSFMWSKVPFNHCSFGVLCRLVGADLVYFLGLPLSSRSLL